MKTFINCEDYEAATDWITMNQEDHRGHLSGKGKAIPLQAWTSPEVSRTLRLPDFTTIST
jgi:hypothetical protein